LLEAYNLNGIGAVYLALSRDTILTKVNHESQSISLKKEVNLNKSIAYLSEAATRLKEIDGSNILIETYNYLQQAFELKGDYKKSLSYFKKYTVLQDSIFSQEKSKQLAALEKAREDDVNRIKIEKQKVQLEAKESEKMFIIYSGIGIVAFVLAILILIAYQRKKSDKLLYNVLPISIAKRLKKKEHPISDHFDQASIIFIDIVGFTAMSKNSDPTDIVRALNKVFTHYDSIASKHGLEKIKTIGDCYMAAAGIPVIQKDNTLKAARMAIEVRDYMVDYYTDHGFKLDVRIGLDCGPVVAGVIGEKKFIYDMWSDAVNTASRMESTGQSGSIHISERFKEAVDEFDEFEFIDRGEMEVKGKGKMNTFFMGSKKLEV
jgi:class 3 adenylate cyclase